MYLVCICCIWPRSQRGFVLGRANCTTFRRPTEISQFWIKANNVRLHNIYLNNMDEKPLFNSCLFSIANDGWKSLKRHITTSVLIWKHSLWLLTMTQNSENNSQSLTYAYTASVIAFKLPFTHLYSTSKNVLSSWKQGFVWSSSVLGTGYSHWLRPEHAACRRGSTSLLHPR